MIRDPRGFNEGGLDGLFPDGAPGTVVPWDRSIFRPVRAEMDRESLRALLLTPPRANQFLDLDPRYLTATQPNIIRPGVEYYLCGEYQRSGRTYADQFKVGNKYPVVLSRGEELLILSGHHRAAAVLLQGKPFRARVVAGPPPATTDEAVVVAPRLLAGGQQPALDHYRCDDAETAEAMINADATAWWPDATEGGIRALLAELAVLPGWVDHQLIYAQTGRIKPVPDWPGETHEFYGCTT